jgi:DNA-binding XRE family transcriptional regulator
MTSDTCFVKLPKIRAIPRGLDAEKTWRNCVRQLRLAVGLTQTALAKRSGMNRSYLSRLESGRHNPTLATLERLAKSLEVMPGSFL